MDISSKKLFLLKMFWPQTFLDFFDPKVFRGRFFLDPKFFRHKIFLDQTFLGFKIVWTQKNFMANIISHRRVLEVTIEFMWVGVFVCKVISVSNPDAV